MAILKTVLHATLLILGIAVAQPTLATENFMQKIGVNLSKEMKLKGTNESLVLNGYALYHRWGDDVYLGALYTTKVEKRAKILLLNNEPIAMVFYFLQDDVNPQLLNHIFTESIVNNNPLINKRPYDLQRLLELKGLLNHSFNAGDVLVFAYSPTTQSLAFTVNGVEKYQWKTGKSFMNVLLNIWLGQFPPRHEFKRAILNFPIDG
jgi:hypothetical protein